MSIINDALKKAQRDPATGSSSPAISELRLKTQFKEELLGKRARINWGPAFILVVLLLIVGPILVPLFSAPFKVGATSAPAHRQAGIAPTTASETTHLISVGGIAPQTRPEMPVRSPAMSPQFAIEEAPVAPPLFRAFPQRIIDFTLSGIVFSEKESYCLVNGKVLKVGETISGASVVKITPDQVTLDTNGRTLVLTTAA